MYNEILKTNELLSGLGTGEYNTDEVNEVLDKCISRVNSADNNYLNQIMSGLDIFNEIIAQKYICQESPKNEDEEDVDKDEIFTRKEAIKEYKMSPGTFDNYRKNGLITSTPPGGRKVYVKKS